ncbi:MAG: hypothetical protein JNM70_05765 [Anaerolineae bacterium]|nr:hypothetical protein [Anaerolineae bacterium]
MELYESTACTATSLMENQHPSPAIQIIIGHIDLEAFVRFSGILDHRTVMRVCCSAGISGGCHIACIAKRGHTCAGEANELARIGTMFMSEVATIGWINRWMPSWVGLPIGASCHP